MARTYGNFTDFIDFSRSSGGTALRRVSYGAELVSNGTFDTNTSGWTDNGWCTLSSPASNLRITSNTTGSPYGYTSLTTVAGSVYRLTVDLQTLSGISATDLFVGTTVGGTENGVKTLSATANGIEFTFVATATTTYVGLNVKASTSGDYLEIDNISVKEVTFDQAGGALEIFNHPDDIPRIEYDTNGVVKGLLIEEARTNLLPRSENLDQWSIAVSEVTFSGKTLIPTAVAAEHYVRETVSLTATKVYTYSALVDAAGYNYCSLSFGASRCWASFNLSSGSVIATSSNATDFSNESATITPFIGTQYLISMTFTCVSGTSTQPGFNVLKTGVSYFSENFTGDGTSGVTVIYAQLEQGSFPTSYIPTSGATATRSADIADIATTNFGYNQKAGTIVVEGETFANSEFPYFVGLESDGTNRYWVYQVASGSSLFLGAEKDDIAQFSSNNTVASNNKIGFSFKKDFFISSSGGALGVPDTSGETVDVTTLYIGARNASEYKLNGHIKSIKYIPRRNSNTQLQEFTS